MDKRTNRLVYGVQLHATAIGVMDRCGEPPGGMTLSLSDPPGNAPQPGSAYNEKTLRVRVLGTSTDRVRRIRWVRGKDLGVTSKESTRVKQISWEEVNTKFNEKA